MQNPFDPGYYCSEELRGFGFAHIGTNVQIAKNCVIIGLPNIWIGDNVRIDPFTTMIASSGRLTLGDYAHVHSYCQIGARGGVTFDAFATIASGCMVYSASDDATGRHMLAGTVPRHLTNPKIAPVHFKKHSGAFAGAIVLPGVTFGEGAFACPRSVVSADVPEWTIVAGSPAVHRSRRLRRILALETSMFPVEAVAA